MFRTILVGTDGSETAAHAVAIAADLAATQEGATLHIVCVQKPIGSSVLGTSEMAVAGSAAAAMQWEEDAKNNLDQTLEQSARDAARGGVQVETHARFGSPAEVLCELATHLGADLIVVGNRGMTGGRRFLGSVPNTVSHHSPCSVLIADTV